MNPDFGGPNAVGNRVSLDFSGLQCCPRHSGNVASVLAPTLLIQEIHLKNLNLHPPPLALRAPNRPTDHGGPKQRQCSRALPTRFLSSVFNKESEEFSLIS